MKNYTGIWLVVFVSLSGLLAGCSRSNAGQPQQASVIPQVVQMKQQNGAFVFDEHTTCCIENEEQQEAARCLSDLFTVSAGFCLKTVSRPASGKNILFVTDPSCPDEAYRLSITPRKITIEASGKSGFFYAVQTLRQLLPPAIDRKKMEIGIDWSVPAVNIEDAPRFNYRGLMLDVSRFFMPKQNVLDIIDCMALLKLNRLHLHLTDDNGWRIEIKKYPLLTEVGAWRVKRKADFPQRPNARPGEQATVGGFYTQDDIREIVAYAAERCIEIIPEIDMPAHSNAALAAYPQLACPVVKDSIRVVPGGGGEAAKIVYCAGNEATFTFLQGVIDEVAALFPSRYIHLGGDEASKEYWKKCPLCQARMKEQHITDPEHLQGYFMSRMADYLRSKGKQMMGWDELTRSPLPEGAIIFGWQGLGKAGYQAALQGHQFVMTPARKLYLIRYQGPQWFEPRTYFGNNTLKDVYTYEPVQPDWTPEAAANLLGVQASLWTEFVDSPEDAEYLLFPRLIALSEVAWTPAGKKDWPGFLKRLDKLLPHFAYLGVNYACSMYNLDHLSLPAGNCLKIALSCIRPDVEIRYTTDGTDPKPTSSLYADTLTVTKNSVIKAATFVDGKCAGKILTLRTDWNKCTAKPVICNGKPETYRLTNGLRGSDKHTDFEWCGWYAEDASFVVDMQQPQDIRQVIVGGISNYGMAVHLPRVLRLSVSDDNREFREVGVIRYTPEEIFRKGIRREEQVFTRLAAHGRYLKVSFENPGKCPSDHVRPGSDTWVYFDEIEVF